MSDIVTRARELLAELNRRGTFSSDVAALREPVSDLVAECERQEAENARLESDLDAVLRERDENEEWANRLAYALGGPGIGEHSSGNNPWQNALDEGESLRAALTQERAAHAEARAENERHRRANLVRTVLDGYDERDEFVNEAINAHDFDGVPWRVAKHMKTRFDDARKLLTETTDAYHNMPGSNSLAVVMSSVRAFLADSPRAQEEGNA